MKFSPNVPDILDFLTEDELDLLKRTGNCPLCGFQFVGYPTGWAWEIHIKECLEKARRLKPYSDLNISLGHAPETLRGD